jgi:hypothetical protein
MCIKQEIQQYKKKGDPFKNFKSHFWEKFLIDFGNTCDYLKSVKINFEIFINPLKFFKNVPPTHIFWPHVL